MLQKLKKNIDEIFYWSTIIIIILSALLYAVFLFIVRIYFNLTINDYTTFGISIFAVFVSVLAVIEPWRSSRLDKKAERKVKIIKAETADDIEKKLEALYKTDLQGKSIDKIEIVNTLTDHSNENRKDVIIIYH